jgi:class 3 adenylate cyclase
VDLGFRLVALAPEGELLIPLELRRLLPRQRLEVQLIDEASLKGIRLDPYPVLQLQVV